MDTDDELITAEEIATIYRVSQQTVRRWARDGVLPTAVVTPGGHRRFRRSDVIALLSPCKAS